MVALSCQVEGVLYHSLAALPADLAYLVGDLLAVRVDIQAELDVIEVTTDLEVGVALALLCATANADVKILSVLANYDEIDILRRFILKRSPDPFQELDRPEVDVLVEVEAHGEKDALLQHARLDPRVAYCSQVDGPISG